MTGVKQSEFVALVPAAGQGARMGSELPKQYLKLGGRTLLAHSVHGLLKTDWIAQVHVVVSPHDTLWRRDPDLLALSEQYANRLYWSAVGGASRKASVLAGLKILADWPAQTWVMVHDAARPGLRAEQLQALRDAIASGAEGALLAKPIVDTVKRQCSPDDVRVGETIDRTGLWAAQTPQVFALGALTRALTQAQGVTDESSAMEAIGVRPRLVAGDWRNDKVTTPSDLALLELALRAPSDITSLPDANETFDEPR